MTQLVDDQVLGNLIRTSDPPTSDEPVFTTGYWYVRLCQAVLGAADRSGVLSGPFAVLSASQRSSAVRNLISLPTSIGLLSLRELGPVIGELRDRHSLNILGMEALAAATHLGAHVRLSVASPRLEAALASEGVRVTISS